MAKQRNRASKADVQSTQLNQMPVPGQADTEFSAEQAANVFNAKQAQGNAQRNEQ
ncbi:hypothetical protein [Ammoniphilus sp. CFH 90114]|uniref:hypothetical protein n=1 Tax=Ammoniphilus sp. CFH 90114 TaxID=2493665 RepID=UPI0013E932F0|nr:hypothetical protein [Ammoniphilus sp. CFH 90114]